MSKFVVRLKTIKYKKDFFCYLFFYPDLDLQAGYFQILSFRSYVFRFFFLKPISFRPLTKYIYPSPNNLNLVPIAEFVVDLLSKAQITALK